ncbi:MAG: di-heme oxidoredictase family protein [Bacteroidota bacterium]
MIKTYRLPVAVFSIIFLIAACQKLMPSLPPDDELLDGPLEGLTTEENAKFLAGDIAFNDDVFTKENGLGPYFVATSCGSCHAGDGKGHPSTTLTRFGQSDTTGNQFLSMGGPQLQNRAIPGYSPEVVPNGAAHAKFTPPANTGLGFLAALTDAQIVSNADANDSNGDGISGVPNYISPPSYFIPQSFHQSLNGKYIGRFGKKAAAIDLLHQTVNAYNQDMGITSVYSPNEPGINGVASPYPDNVPDPEVSSATVLNVVFYLRTLKAPIQRNQTDADVIAGKEIFSAIECSKCHIPEWTTGASDISALSFKTFYPYTDLLLHDMGTGLDDGYTEGMAKTGEWKTPPLWGLGLSPSSQGGSYYLMHDGRATSIEEAILMHGGEAQNSKSLYEALSSGEKQKLLKFLESL